jgi:hypothetical protein
LWERRRILKDRIPHPRRRSLAQRLPLTKKRQERLRILVCDPHTYRHVSRADPSLSWNVRVDLDFEDEEEVTQHDVPDRSLAEHMMQPVAARPLLEIVTEDEPEIIIEPPDEADTVLPPEDTLLPESESALEHRRSKVPMVMALISTGALALLLGWLYLSGSILAH